MSYVGVSMAVIAVVSSVKNNMDTAHNAKQTAKSNAKWAKRDQDVGFNNLQLKGEDVQRQLGNALSELSDKSKASGAKVLVKSAETNIYGNTAARLKMVNDTRAALNADSLAQTADAKMLEIEQQMSQVSYNKQAKDVQIANIYRQEMSTQKDALEIGAEAYSTYHAFKGSAGTTSSGGGGSGYSNLQTLEGGV